MLWGGRKTANKYHWRVWGVLAVFQPHWVCPHSRFVCFHGLHFSGSRLLCWELSEAGPGLYALLRSKSQVQVLRYSTKAQTWLGLRFVPFPGPSSSGDQVLGKHSRPQLKAATYHLPRPSRLVFWVYNWRTISGGCRWSRIPRILG